MNPSERLSIERIKTFGPDSPMLHNDALKVVALVERMVAAEIGDPESDPDYHAFVDGQLKNCRCSYRYAPCEGVLAGGRCDELSDWGELTR